MEINVKRRRGGLQQRLDEEQRQRTRSSKLANHLLTQYAWGKMSVQEVQALAALAVEDLKEGNSTVVFTDLIQLSKLGSSGQHKQKIKHVNNAMNVTGLTVQPDLMHVKYLGYQQFWLGSVMWMLVNEILPASPLANLRGIGLYVLRWQRRHNVSAKFPLGAFQKLSIFQRKKGYPKLRGKGAHVRHLAGALSSLWNSPTMFV